MAQSGADNLLDLDAPSSTGVPAGATVPAAAEADAKKASAEGAAANELDDMDAWGDFQSVEPTAGGADLGAPAAQPAAAAPQPAQEKAVDSFDPLVAPAQQESNAPADQLFSASELEDLGGAPASPDAGHKKALITLDEVQDQFDPLADKPVPQAAVEESSQVPAGGLMSSNSAQGPSSAGSAAPPAAAGGYPVVGSPAISPAVPKAVPAGKGGGVSDLLGLSGEEEEEEVFLSAVPADAQGSKAMELEDPEKVTIIVYHKGDKNMVGWYTDTPASDIKVAVLCACDAIMDGGFVLREVQLNEDGSEPNLDSDQPTGKVYEYEQFGELQNNAAYLLEPAEEREDLKGLAGDRWRRLRVCIDPMMHVEAQVAVDRMRRGSNLLKHTRYGFPHLRQFQLSDDKKRLVWYSGAKKKDDSVVHLPEVTEIRLGQTTPVFLNYRLPMLEHLSFSLVYGPKGKKTLDLTCKDEFEFDHWVTGLKAIIYSLKQKPIAKEQLLGHSKRFKKAVEKMNSSIKLTRLPEVKEKGHVGLDDCIEIVTHTPQQLETKLSRLRERCKTVSQQVSRLDHHAAAEMEVDFSLLAGKGPAYASVFVQDEDAQDEEMEIRRMHQLVEQTTQVLQQARAELNALDPKNQRAAEGASGSADPAPGAQAEGSSAAAAQTPAAKAKAKSKKESTACKHVDQLLWKAEVDLENVEDMYLRHIDNQKETTTPFSISIADMNSKLSQAASEVEDTFNQKISDIKGWFS